MVSHLPRGAYWLVLLHLPGLGRSDMIRAAEFRIPSVYPGDPEEALWDYRLLPGCKREYLLLAVMPRPTSAPAAGAYLPLFHAVDLRLPRRGEEVTLFEEGISDTLRRSARDDYTLLSREENAPPRQRSPLLPHRGYRGAFGGRKAHPLLRTALLSLLLASSLFTITVHRELQSRRSLYTQLISSPGAGRTILEEEIALKRLSAAELKALPAAVSRQNPGPLGILRDLERLLPPETEILRLLCTEGRLQLELLGPEALRTAESLCGDLAFDEVSLGEIRRQRGVEGVSGREIYRVGMRILP